MDDLEAERDRLLEAAIEAIFVLDSEGDDADLNQKARELLYRATRQSVAERRARVLQRLSR